jgi:GNAT superfamily N-acetyltransferase
MDLHELAKLHREEILREMERNTGGGSHDPGKGSVGPPDRRSRARGGPSGVFPRWKRAAPPRKGSRRTHPERNQAEWEGALAHFPEHAAILVAETAGRLLGVAGAGSARDRALDPVATGELYALYVHPNEWGNGYGFALHEAAVRHPVDKGFDSAVLWVLAGNVRARRFYERRGSRTDGGVGDEDGVPKLSYRFEPLHGRTTSAGGAA